MRLSHWLALLLISLAAIAAGGETPRTLVVGSKPNVPPYEYVDAAGQLDGFCIEVLRTVAARQNLPVDFLRLSNQEVWEAFDQQRIDIISGAVYTEERTQSMDFTVPLAMLQYRLLVRERTLDIRSERDLQGRQVLVVQRSHMASYAEARGLRTKGYPGYDACLAALAAGEGEAALVPRFTWLHLAKRLPLAGLKEVPTEIYPHRICFAVRKGDSGLLAKLNEGIFELKNSGKLDEIYDRHLGSLERAQLPLEKAFRKLAGFLLPALLGVGFLVHLGWTFALRRLVKRRTAALQAELVRRSAAEAELEQTIGQLSHALAEVKQLSGLLPICAGCKKIRDEGGQWQPIEGFISANSEAQFSHGLCPECVSTLYPEFAKGRDAGQG